MLKANTAPNSKVGRGIGSFIAPRACARGTDPTLSEGKGSGELGLNPRFSLYGARRQGHAKLGSDGLLWLYLHVIVTAVKQTLNLIGQRN